MDVAAPVGEVLDRLGRIRVAGALNIYDEDDCVEWGDAPGLATERRLALLDHLTSRWTAPAVLVGEAPGKDGARWCGVPFTSCRQLRGSGPTEPTATVMHRVLSDLGCEREVLLWNSSMLFAPGNRDPRRAEVGACAEVLEMVCRGRAVFAIGRFAQVATGAPYIRHPSHGGVARFAEGLRVALRSPAGTDVGEALGRLDVADPAQLTGPNGRGRRLTVRHRPYTATNVVLRPWFVDRRGGLRGHVRAADGFLPAPPRGGAADRGAPAPSSPGRAATAHREEVDRRAR